MAAGASTSRHLGQPHPCLAPAHLHADAGVILAEARLALGAGALLAADIALGVGGALQRRGGAARQPASWAPCHAVRAGQPASWALTARLLSEAWQRQRAAMHERTH